MLYPDDRPAPVPGLEGPLEPPTRLDREPPVLWGCTAPELLVLLVGSLLLTVPLGLALALWLGAGFLALPGAGLATFMLVRLGAARLRDLKRGRPEQYYPHRLQKLAMRVGLLKLRYLDYSGPWRLGREADDGLS